MYSSLPFRLFRSLLEKHHINDSYQFTARCTDNHLVFYVPLICDFIWMGVGNTLQANRIIDWYSSCVQSALNYVDHHFWRIFYLNIKVQCNMKCRDLSISTCTHTHTANIQKFPQRKSIWLCHAFDWLFLFLEFGKSFHEYKLHQLYQIYIEYTQHYGMRMWVYCVVDASMECKL